MHFMHSFHEDNMPNDEIIGLVHEWKDSTFSSNLHKQSEDVQRLCTMVCTSIKYQRDTMQQTFHDGLNQIPGCQIPNFISLSAGNRQFITVDPHLLSIIQNWHRMIRACIQQKSGTIWASG